MTSTVSVEDHTFLIDHGDGGDAKFREHVNNIKHGPVMVAVAIG
jgi:hypothetical protein